jgi:polyphosphate kinase
VYLGSADMMQRNLDRRVEILFPIEDEKLRTELMKSLIKVSFKDNQKARILLPDMTYKTIIARDGDKIINSQEWLMKHALKNSGELIKS